MGLMCWPQAAEVWWFRDRPRSADHIDTRGAVADKFSRKHVSRLAALFHHKNL
jgi:hypothetical protein